ncbi:MAG TPA: M10 family metallopeptidase C-terminal domain-containing protein [Caulobacteraceae bacterium]|nr:M10 family metallopeptidase C-terminal domain-containing protein [Caulobacteraceae bacterium]
MQCGQPTVHYTADDGGSTTAALPPEFDLSQILLQLTTQWTGAEGTTRTWMNTDVVYYSMPDTAPNLSSSEDNGFQIMSPVKKDAARTSFELWDDLMAIDLTENNDPNTDITFAYSSTTGNSTYASMRTSGQGPDYDLSSTRIWLASQWTSHDQDSDMVFGGYGYITYIHEIGHALGLSHPGTYNGTADFEDDAEYLQDTRQWSVMSYFDADENGSGVDHRGSDNQWKYASTPMLHDVMAIQAKYGADMTTRTGNTVYGFNSTADKSVFDFDVNFDPIICIWDAGGEDTLNVSGYSTNQRISLVPGTYSDIGHMTMNVAIAFGATIERAIGGSGGDHITGNDAANTINGNAGNDTILGGLGNDILIGGVGGDAMNGGAGLDYASYITATAGVTVNLTTLVHGGDALGDTFAEVERFRLSSFADDFTGGVGTDYAYGAEGNDVLRGAQGFDRLYGQAGDDQLFGDADNDVLIGGEGADQLNGGVGAKDAASYETAEAAVSLNLGTGVHTGDALGDVFTDIEYFMLSSHNDTFVGGAGADEAQGRGGADTLSGAGGADWMRGQEGDDILNGDLGDDVLEGGAGADQLNGGDGTDYASYYQAAGVNLATGVHTGDAAGDTFSSIERFRMSGYDDSFFGSAGNDWVAGYMGNDTLNGADGHDTLNGGGSSDVLIGGNGNDKLIGEAGNDTLTGGAGSDAFQVTAAAFGNDVVTDFGAGDYIRVTGIAGVDAFNDLTVSQNGANAVITFPDGSTITLNGVSAATVDAADFSFG